MFTKEGETCQNYQEVNLCMKVHFQNINNT